MRIDKSVLVQLVLAGAVVSALPAFALASAPWETPLQTLVSYITGSTGQLMATLAVAVVGVLAFMGRISWGWAGAVVFGITCVFGAGQYVATFHP